jgi:hypothetical protein
LRLIEASHLSLLPNSVIRSFSSRSLRLRCMLGWDWKERIRSQLHELQSLTKSRGADNVVNTFSDIRLFLKWQPGCINRMALPLSCFGDNNLLSRFDLIAFQQHSTTRCAIDSYSSPPSARYNFLHNGLLQCHLR